MTIDVMHPVAKQRRDDLTAKGYCLNGESHGPAVCGRLCRWCRAVHSRGVQNVLADPKGVVPPPDYRFLPRSPTWRAPRSRSESVTPAG